MAVGGNSHQQSGRFFLRKNLSAVRKEGSLLIKNLLLLTADSRQPTAIPADIRKKKCGILQSVKSTITSIASDSP